MSAPDTTRAYVGLGANLGRREESIGSAIRMVNDLADVRVSRQSRLMENPAVGGPEDSPPFLNAVIEIETSLAPEVLLQHVLSIEHALGRERRQKWAPRTIDLDLLLFGDTVISRPDLRIPHPLMHLREFVLAPLAEIAPRAMHPVLRQTAAQMLEKLRRPA